MVQVTDFQKTKPSVFLIDDERQLVLEMINKFKFDRFAAESKYGLSIGANIAKWLVEAGIVEREEHADVSGQKYVHYIINRRRLDMALGIKQFKLDDAQDKCGLTREQEIAVLQYLWARHNDSKWPSACDTYNKIVELFGITYNNITKYDDSFLGGIGIVPPVDDAMSDDQRAAIVKRLAELNVLLTELDEIGGDWIVIDGMPPLHLEQIRGDRHVFVREYVQQPINPESVRKAREISETALREQDAFIYTMTAMRDAYMDGFFKFDQKSGQWSRLTSGRLCSCGQPAMLDSDLCADCRTIAEESTTTAPANPQHPDNFGDWISRPVGYPGEPYIRTTPKPSSEVIAWNQPLKRNDH